MDRPIIRRRREPAAAAGTIAKREDVFPFVAGVAVTLRSFPRKIVQRLPCARIVHVRVGGPQSLGPPDKEQVTTRVEDVALGDVDDEVGAVVGIDSH